MNTKLLKILPLLAILASCDAGVVGTRFVAEGEEYEHRGGVEETKSVEFNLQSEDWLSTKTSLGSGLESVFTGAVMAAYDAETGTLDSETSISPDALGRNFSINLPAGKTYDFYLIGNLWNVTKSDGEASAIAFPLKESELVDMIYRMDGSDVDSSLRRERFSETSRWGIPLCWSLAGVKVGASRTVNIVMKRLFSKLSVTVDHSGLSSSQLSDFVNGSMYIRNINCKLAPFSNGGSRAESSKDVLEVGDSEMTMDNALAKEYVFYVPENRQGVLMPGNADPARKDIEGVEEATGGKGRSELLTYVEFKGKVDSNAGGYGGTAVYRFFPGHDDTSDFEIERGKHIRIRLGFKVGSLFNPDWKIETEDDFSDDRVFYLSSELAGKLPEGQKIVVRKNRPGVFDLNVALSDGGANRILDARLVDAGYEPESLRDIAWTSDFWSGTHDVENEPMRKKLADLGIDVSFANGRFTLAVKDPSKFVPGRQVPVELTLYPGGSTIGAVIQTGPDIVMKEEKGRDLSNNFYMAQRRSYSFSGFAGSKIYYYADQDQCGASSGGKHTFNRQWKASDSPSAPFPTCKVGADGKLVYPFDDPKSYAQQSISASSRLEVCSFYPNNFLASHGYSSKGGTLYVCSDDPLNDGVFAVPVKVQEPMFRNFVQSVAGKPLLPMDGTEYSIKPSFYTPSGGSLSQSVFDDILYAQFLAPKVTCNQSDYPWSGSVVCDTKSNMIYIGKTSLASGNLEDAQMSSDIVARLAVSGNPASGLFDATPRYLECRLSRPSQPYSAVSAKSMYFLANTAEKTMDGVMDYALGFSFPGGDVSRYKIEMESNGVKYTTSRFPYETIEPRLDLKVDDQGVHFRYVETDQVMESASGEKVPGGLIVPYGRQDVHLTVTNKWDGRSIKYDWALDIRYQLNLGQYAVLDESRYGTVYFVTKKNAAYLDAIGADVPSSVRHWMLGTLGTNEWMKHVQTNMNYYNGSAYCQASGPYYGYPRKDFDVKYISSASNSWTSDLARKAFEQGSITWLDRLNLVDASNVVQSVPCADQAITGSPYLEVLLHTTKYGYSFMNGF